MRGISHSSCHEGVYFLVHSPSLREIGRGTQGSNVKQKLWRKAPCLLTLRLFSGLLRSWLSDTSEDQLPRDGSVRASLGSPTWIHQVSLPQMIFHGQFDMGCSLYVSLIPSESGCVQLTVKTSQHNNQV